MTEPLSEHDVAGATAPRHESFGESHPLSTLDRLGRWLSVRRVRAAVGPVPGKAVADIGCGYRADLSRHLFDRAQSLLLVDVSIDHALAERRGVRIVEGYLPQAMSQVDTASLDVILCNNVLEHLWEPELTLREIRRCLRPGGTAVINVPSWRGKRFLELAAFRFGLAPAAEMDDHKCYYDPADLWPLLVRAGFRPSRIRCGTQKGGLNTLAVCRA